jgi:hypothetical protein
MWTCMIRRAMRPARKPRMIYQMMCNIRGGVGRRSLIWGDRDCGCPDHVISSTDSCRFFTGLRGIKESESIRFILTLHPIIASEGSSFPAVCSDRLKPRIHFGDNLKGATKSTSALKRSDNCANLPFWQREERKLGADNGARRMSLWGRTRERIREARILSGNGASLKVLYPGSDIAAKWRRAPASRIELVAARICLRSSPSIARVTSSCSAFRCANCCAIVCRRW